MKRIFLLVTLGVLLVNHKARAQDDLEALLNTDKPKKEFVRGTFKGTRVINLQSVEKVAPGALQFLIQHRFGPINGGAYQLYGLDQATIRFALEYGITKFLMAGIGRSSFGKTYDGFVKASLIRQSKGSNSIPFSLLYFGSTALNTLKWADPGIKNYFSSRLSYTHQIIIGSKVNESFSIEIVPTLIHKNLVEAANDPNGIYAIGAGLRYKLSKRMSLNMEYVYRIPPKDKSAPSYVNYYNSFSLGLDIETGGHVFQLHLTNSLPMIEKGFIAETSERWGNGGIHLGFNISRDFILKSKKKTSDEW
jgi:hypothetical protein